MIPYGRQQITDEDIEAVVAALQSDFITQGPLVGRFEEVVSKGCGARDAVACNSATSALHLACLALGLGPGDRLWTTPNTFVASANCARYCGAEVDFVDIDSETWNISVGSLEEKLVAAERTGKLPKILVAVHFAGQPTEQETIRSLADRYGFRIIEDASHAAGARRNGEPVGSCRWSDITVFSFHPVKILTTGEGGMALTNSGELAARMRLLRSHGITRDSAQFVALPSSGASADEAGKSPPAYYYEMQELGFNYRITDIQCALGISQFKRLGQNIEIRNSIALRYDSALRDTGLQLPFVADGNRSAFHLYVVLVSNPASRDAFYDRLRHVGIAVNVHYLPVHLQPYYRKQGFSEGQFPNAESYSLRSVTLPIYATLAERDQEFVIESVKAAL